MLIKKEIGIEIGIGMSEYGVDVPSVEENRKKFTDDIMNKIKTKNFTCSKFILETIADGAKKGQSYWILNLVNCSYDEKVTTILTEKGYTVSIKKKTEGFFEYNDNLII